MIKLDAIDRQLLRLLQENNQISIRALAEASETSAPTCMRRLRRLRSKKVILGDVAVIDPAALELGLKVMVEITLERQSAADLNAFERKMAKLPQIQRCCEISGESDFLLTVLIKDMHTYSEFSRTHFAGNPGIKVFRSMFVMRESKRLFQIPID